nr:6-O-methyltransferase 1 [Phyla nodiflora]
MEAGKTIQLQQEEESALLELWEYIFGFTPMAILKCAIELKIPEALESQNGSMALSDLSTALNCSTAVLHRIMRYLVHRGIFKQKLTSQESTICYVQTALSRLLIRKDEGGGLADLLLLESSPVMLAPWHNLGLRASKSDVSAFEAAHGGDVWEYAEGNPVHSKLINDAMAGHARRAVMAIVDQCAEAFEGIGSLVDVGGGDGTALRTLVRACPGIRGINFDLPHVVSVAPQCDGIEHVAGDMFQLVPKADAAFLMWVLHDWSDDECIQILKRCREAIPEEAGKVIIAEAVIDVGEKDAYSDVRLALDMVMLAHTEKGKERTLKEWEYVIKAAGFRSFTVKHIKEIVSVIEVYP